MQKARCVRIVYRDSYITSFRRMIKNKLVLASFVLISLGIILFAISLQQAQVIDSKLIQTGSVAVDNSSYSSVYFGEPANLNSTLTFVIPSNHAVQYKIYSINNYTVNFHAKTSIALVSEGYAFNGTKVDVKPVSNPQGQEYMMMLKSNNGASFKVYADITANIFLAEPSNKNVGGPGVMFGMVGAVLLAAKISFIYGQLKTI
ncbi:hypothetical protein IX51_07190 [uncultured archaeon]|nr:hypothetical protein IX51_07190 [uncultured archaeon]